MRTYIAMIVEHQWIPLWRQLDDMIKDQPRKAEALREDMGEMEFTVSVTAKSRVEAAKKIRKENPGCKILGWAVTK